MKKTYVTKLATIILLLSTISSCKEESLSCSRNLTDSSFSLSDTAEQTPDKIREVYEAYKANGGTLDYDTWLATIKGEKGDTGEKGDKGDKREDGIGIEKVEKTSSVDNVDTYTITYTDGSTSTFTVTNGTNGKDGTDGQEGTNGIDGKDGADGKDGHTPVIAVNADGYWTVDGESTGVKALGTSGKDGKGIASVSSSLDSEGNTVLSFVYTDGTTQTFTIRKGEKGDAGETGPQGEQGLQGEKGDRGDSLFTGNGAPASTLGNNGDSYIDATTGDVYRKDDGIWTNIGNIKGDKGEQGIQGEKGDTGNGIEKIEKESSEGNVDTYAITYTDGTVTHFTVTNGTNGKDGDKGETGDAGHTPEITIDSNGYWCVDGVSTGIKAKGDKGDKGEKGDPGKDGEDGNDGKGVTEVTYSFDSDGNTIVTFSFTDGTTQEVKILRGQKGDTGETGQTGPQGEKGLTGDKGEAGRSLLTGNGEPSSSLGNNGDSYIDLDTFDYYTRENGFWTKQGNITGKQGEKGETGSQGPKGDTGEKGDTGISVTSTKIDDDGNLIVTLSDGSVINAGYVGKTEKYTVTFHVDGEIIATRIVDYDSTVDEPTAEESAGYTITDWYVKASDAATADNVSWKFDGYFANRVTGNLDLWATYIENEYTVSFVDNEKNQIFQTTTVKYNENFDISSYCESHFTGYSLVFRDGDDNDYIMKGTWRTASNVTLYAHYIANNYTLTFNPDGGTCDVSSMAVTYDSQYSLPTPARDHYYFLGWFDSSDKKLSQRATWKRAENVSLKAKWTTQASTYIFDAGNGTCEMDSMQINWGSSYSLPTPTWEGHTFYAWYLDRTAKVEPTGEKWKYSDEGGFLYAVWEVNLGSYPQNHVNDETLITSLNSLTETNSKGWYEYDGEEYAKVKASPCHLSHDVKKGGSYDYYDDDYTFSDGTTLVDGTTYWFKVEPIEWRILSGSLITTLKLLEAPIQYYSSIVDRTIDGSTISADNYKYSNIRAWMNGLDGSSYNVDNYTGKGFIDIAFTDEEKEQIQITTVDNSKNTFCENTEDKVFSLSRLETYDYFEKKYGTPFDSGAQPTDYALAKGAYKSIETSYNRLNNGYWWTRTAFDYGYQVYGITPSSIESGFTVSGSLCVRPAINIRIS